MRKKLIALALTAGMMVSFVPLADVNFTAVYAAETDETEETEETRIHYSWQDAPIQITVQPQSVSVTEGESVTFYINASGRELRYQWQLSEDDGETWHNGLCTDPAYTTTAALGKNGRLARCVLTDADGHSMISQPARLTVYKAVVEEVVVEEEPENYHTRKDTDEDYVIGESGWGENTLLRFNPNLKNVVVPDTVDAIADKTLFWGGNQMETLTIPASCTSIVNVFGNNPLQGCVKLTTLIVDEDNPCYAAKDGVLFNKDFTTLFACIPSKTGDYVVPDTVTRIDDWAFAGCDLTSITMSDSVTSIGEGAFTGCENLTDVTLSNSISTLYTETFMWCYRLTHLTIPTSVAVIDSGINAAVSGSAIGHVEVDSSDSYFTSQDGVLFSKDMTILVWHPFSAYNLPYDYYDWPEDRQDYEDYYTDYDKVYTIPDTVHTIGKGAFSNYYFDSLLGAVVMPRSVTLIQDFPWVKDLYYEGSQEEWALVHITEGNEEALAYTTIHFNYEGLAYMMDSFAKKDHTAVAQDESVITESVPEISGVPVTQDEAVLEMPPEILETPTEAQKGITTDLPKAALEMTPEILEIPAEAQEGIAADLPEAAPEMTPELFEIPAEMEKVMRVELAEAIPEIRPETADLPAAASEAVRMESAEPAPAVTPNTAKTKTASNAVIESYVPSVSVNALCMNLGLSGIALSLAAAVVRRRRRRFFAGSLIPKAA